MERLAGTSLAARFRQHQAKMNNHTFLLLSVRKVSPSPPSPILPLPVLLRQGTKVSTQHCFCLPLFSCRQRCRYTTNLKSILTAKQVLW